jgi:serine/threonine protein kinase
LQALAASANGNIINIMAVCFDPLAIIMEQCDTSLAAYLNNRRAAAAAAEAPLTSYPPLSWQLVINLAKQAAAALTELHRRPSGILHNDVRAANMVLVTAGSNQQTTSSKVGVQQQLTLKICDYGLAEFVGSKEEAVVRTVTDPKWLAPEIDVHSASKRVNKKTDVFGLGELQPYAAGVVLIVC